MLRDDRLPARRDLLDGFVPTDALPLAASLRAHAPQRIEQPVRMIDPFQIRAHFGAEPALRNGMLFLRIETHRAPILHLGNSGTGIGAIVRARATHYARISVGRWRRFDGGHEQTPSPYTGTFHSIVRENGTVGKGQVARSEQANAPQSRQ